MTWQAAISRALEFARANPDRRYYVAGFNHSWRYGESEWLYEVRYAGPVTR